MIDPSLIPLITIFGPIIGASIGATVTYYVVVKRKRLTIYYTQTEKMEEPLHPYHPFLQVEPKPMVPGWLQHAYIGVKNTGNASIKDIVIDAKSSSSYHGHLAQVSAKDENLANAVSAEWLAPDEKTGVYVKLSLAYLNSGEAFQVELIWDGVDKDLSVYCRLEDVDVHAKQTGFSEMLKLSDPFDKTRWKRLERQVKRWERNRAEAPSRGS